jgi:outer membrane protein assembly factor BamB
MKFRFWRLICLLGILAAGAGALAAAPGDLLWTAQTGGVIFGAPAIGPGGEIIVGSEDGKVYCFSAAGALLWTFSGATDWIDSAPTIGAVYAGSWDGALYAIDRLSGAMLWKFETGGMVIASPAVAPDGVIYVASNDTFLYAVHPDGTQKWVSHSVNSFEPINGSPVLNRAGDTVFFGNDGGFFFAVDAATGTERWSFSVTAIHPPASADIDPAISSAAAIGRDGSIYFGSENGYLYALTSSGQLRWSYKAAEPIRSAPAISSNGAITFAAQDGYLYSLDSEGFQIWETFVGDVFYCSPALDAAGNILIAAYAGSDSTDFIMVDAGGNMVWEHRIAGVNDSSPNIAPDGAVYFGAHDGRLYKFAGDFPLMGGTWPRFQANIAQTGFTAATVPATLLDYFPEISDQQDGWVYVPWFGQGWIRDAGLPWIEHIDHGHVFLGSPLDGGLWFHDPRLDAWLFAAKAVPGYLYFPAASSWIYHQALDEPANARRWFHDLARHQWFSD